MKKDIDWANLSFSYMPTDYRFVAHYKDGKWDEGALVKDDKVTISESAGVLQYAQTCFEGLKVYTAKNGDTVAFRPDMNAKRLKDSADRLKIPAISEEMFLHALDEVVLANLDWVPPYGSGATLYVRPFLFGSGPVIGVKPSSEYEFRMFVTPVGPYFKGGVKPIRLLLSQYDRAAPHGTGHIKAGLNYAMSLYPGELAHELGYNENMYLDAATRTYVEETGGANFLFVKKDGNLVTPKSDTILPSITRRSLVQIAEDMGLSVEQRPVRFDEIGEFAECGLCGTAAVISPVGSVTTMDGKVVEFPSGMDEMGPVLAKLRKTICGMQDGEIPAPAGWIRTIKKA